MANPVEKSECDQHMNELRREMLQCMESRDLRIMYDLSKAIDEKLNVLNAGWTTKLDASTEKIDSFINLQTKLGYGIGIALIIILVGVIMGRGFDYFLMVV